jgi:hypothetical protein
VEPHNWLHSRLPLPPFLLHPLSSSSVSSLPPPPLLLHFSDPTTLCLNSGLPRPDPGHGHPFWAVAGAIGVGDDGQHRSSVSAQGGG